MVAQCLTDQQNLLLYLSCEIGALGTRWEEVIVGPPRRDMASHVILRSVRRSVRISGRVGGYV